LHTSEESSRCAAECEASRVDGATSRGYNVAPYLSKGNDKFSFGWKLRRESKGTPAISIVATLLDFIEPSE
jgi:hypothetical protein